LTAQVIGSFYAETIDDFSGTVPFPVPIPEPTNLALWVPITVTPIALLRTLLSKRGAGSNAVALRISVPRPKDVSRGEG